MRVLEILLKIDKLNSLTKSFINYLIDSGNFVTVATENDLEYLSTYSYNLKIVSSITEADFDYFIDFTNHSTNALKNQINLALYMSDFDLSIYLLNTENKIISYRSVAMSNAITTDGLALQYVIDEVTDSFIDGIIELQRSSVAELDSGYLDINQHSQNIFPDFVTYLTGSDEIAMFYHLMNHDEMLVKLDNCTQHDQPNHTPISVNIDKSLSNNDLQVILVLLLSLLNGRATGIYSYQYKHQNKVIDKFIKINDNSLIDDIKLEISNPMYEIFDNVFAHDILSGQSQDIVLSHEDIATTNSQIKFVITENNITIHNFKSAENISEYLQNILTKYIQATSNTSYYELIKDIGITKSLMQIPCLGNYSYNKQETLISIFEEQARKVPNNIALVYNDISYSYNELNDICNKIGSYLINEVGIIPNDMIALYLARNEYMLIAILSVLKAGAAYVPIDPSYPEERISHILSDTKAKLVLTNVELLDKLVSFNYSIIINTIENLYNKLDNDDNFSNTNSKASADDLAYVIYTSGTTGKPKGTLLHHAGVINMIKAQSTAFQLNHDGNYKNCLWYSSYVFDAHVSELFTAILNGNTIHIIDDSIRHDFEKLTNYISANKIHIATIPPALLSKESLLPLETIVVAGDKTDRDIIDAYYQNGINIINAYGPTETSVCATLHLYQSDGYNNIGVALTNVTTYVLDHKLNPVPLGVVGELYIGGAGVAKGYLNLPELTNERFIPNPFQTSVERINDINTIIYKTGDLVAINEKGQLEYIGRNDFQIKINGYRVELAEIENAMQQFPNLKQAVVMAQSISGNNKALVGYYVSSDNIDEKALEAFLTAQVPQYMVPRIFVRLQAFPISISGKIDRKAIPKVDLAKSKNYAPPKNDVQVELCHIWAAVLGDNYNEISIKDDFFKLGGNSIAAIKIAQKLMRSGYYIAIKDIFKYKTIEEISLHLVKEDLAHNQQNHFIDDFNYLLNDDIEWANRANNVQKGLVTYSMQHPESDAYLVQIKFDYNCSINIDHLKKAWEIAVKRFSSLRSSFEIVNNEIVQIVHKDVPINWNYYDVSSLVSPQQKEFMDKLIQSDRKTLYKLHLPPLFRLYLVKNSLNNYTFMFSNHHAIIDGWGINVLFDFIHETYHALQHNLLLSNSTNDFSYELASKYCSNNSNRDLEYWHKLLSNVEPVNEINALALKTINTGQTFENNSEYVLQVTQQIHDLIEAVSIKESVTLNSIFQFVWHKLFNIFTQSATTIVGTVVTGRNINSASIDSAVGIFINTLPIVLTWDNSNSIIEQIHQVNNLIIDANNHSLTFLGDIQQDNKLFNNIFVFQDVRDLLNTDRVDIVNIQDMQKLDFPITVELIQNSDNIKLKIRYDNNVFSAQRIDYLVTYARYILYSTLNNLNSNHTILNQVPSYELEQLESLQGHINNNNPMNIVDLFEKQVLKSPQAVALVCGNKSFTYAELNAISNKFANYLKHNCNVKAKDFVALYLERNEYVIIAILSVLKLGAVYVPIDIDYPNERVEYILKDTQANLLIKNLHDNKDNLLAYLVDNICDINAVIESKLFTNLSEENLNQSITHDDLSYIIYTSGTTGNPKGVMVHHGGVVNTVTDLYSIYDIKLGNKVMAFTSYVFDVSVSEFFVALINAGELHLITNEIRTNPNKISDYIIRNNINYAYLPPVVLANLPKIGYKSLRAIIYAGEPCDITTGKYWSNTKIKLFNYYGPTETSIYSIGKQVIDGDVHLIGRPMNNVKAYILNSELNHVPHGVVGELYIGGNGVTKGYLNLPEATQERFINNKYQTEHERSLNLNNTLYKTGDLVRYNGNNIEYIGRNDSQVKIRGFRIELSEIDNLLNNYPSINSSASMVHSINNSKAIISFYVSNKSIDNLKIIEYLEQRLPYYMVPSFVINLEKLPMTINGKLDKKKLIEHISNNLTQEIKQPESNLEIELREIWSQVLNLRSVEIGTNSNFFRLGGNSISIVNLITQINKRLGYKVDFSIIHKHPTIKSFGEFITTSSHNALVNLLNINYDYNKPMLVLFHTARGSSEVYLKFASMLTQYYDVYLVDSYNLAQFHEKTYIESLNELTEKYLNELSKYVVNYNQVLVAGWSFGGIIAHEAVAKLSKSAKNSYSLLMFDTYTPHTLETILDGVNLSVHMEDIYASNVQKEVGQIHDAMYKEFKSDENIKDINYYLIKANDADIFIKDHKARVIITKEHFNGWEKYFRNILSYPINATHETLFDDINLNKMVSYMLDINKRIKK